MAMLYPTVTGSGTWETVMPQLRPLVRAEASAAPYFHLTIEREAPWQWALEDDAGGYVAGAAIMPERHGGCERGWVCAFPGERLRSGVQIRPLIRLFRMLCDAGVYDELRAWVDAHDARAIAFAEAFGMRYDCGPASGFSPAGRDLSLYLWRRD